MSDLISVFHIDWKLLLAQVVNFAIVFWLISVIVWRPLKKMMQDRVDTIQSGIDATKHSETLLSQAKNTVKLIEFEAEKSATSIRAKAESEYTAQIESAKSHAADAAQAIIDLAKKHSDSEHSNMMKVFRGESVDIVMNATRTLLDSELKDADQKKKFIENLLSHAK